MVLFFRKEHLPFLLALATLPALAAPSETIVVTAVRRATRLEKTPVSVSVIGGATLARSGVRELTQLSGSVPGLTLNQSPGALPQVSLRGVGTSAANQLFEQSVGLFLDGIYQPRAREYRDALFDVQQVEVIKGAQGVLYGKNTSVGAITVTTNNPGSTYSGYLAGDYETSFGSYSTEGAVNLPVTPRIDVRIAALYADDAGYVRNVTTGQEEGGTRRWVVRGTVVDRISDDVTATLKLQAGHSQTSGDLFEWVQSIDIGLLEKYGVIDGGVVPYLKYESSAPFGQNYDRQNSYQPSLRVVWSLPNDATLTSTTGYSAFRFADGLDSDASPGPIPTVYSQFHEGFSQVSQELRYASAAENLISYQAGLYALHSHDSFEYNNTLKDLFLLPQIPALGVTGQEAQYFEQSDTSISGFAQADWHITSALKLSLGGRLAQENKSGTYTKDVSNLGDAGSYIFVAVPRLAAPISARLDDTSFDFSGVLSDELTDHTLLFGSVSQGTKSGAFNNTAVSGVASPTPFTVRPEVTTAFEAGLKQRFWGDRGFFSAAAYHMHIDGYQDSYYSSSALGFLVRSVNADTTGFEAETRLRPLPWLNIFGNTGYEPQADLTSGERLQRAPRFTANIGAETSNAITDRWAVETEAQLQYSSAYLNQSAIAPGDNTTGDYAIANLRLAGVDKRDGVELSLRVDNLLDRRYITYSYGSLLSTEYLPGGGGTPLGSVGMYNRPRTFTLGLRKNF